VPSARGGLAVDLVDHRRTDRAHECPGRVGFRGVALADLAGEDAEVGHEGVLGRIGAAPEAEGSGEGAAHDGGDAGPALGQAVAEGRERGIHCRQLAEVDERQGDFGRVPFGLCLGLEPLDQG